MIYSILQDTFTDIQIAGANTFHKYSLRPDNFLIIVDFLCLLFEIELN